MIKRCIGISSLTEEEYGRIYGMISESARSAVDRKRCPDDKRLSLCGAMLARRCAAELCGVDETAVKIIKDPLGKPQVADMPVYISISHSGEYAVAVAAESPVGIDIEKIRTIRPGMAKRICTDGEIEELFGTADVPREDAMEYSEREALSLKLLRLWTLKEAYLKNLGEGLSGGLRSLSLKINGSVITGPDGYSFSSEESPEGYITSVCVKNI